MGLPAPKLEDLPRCTYEDYIPCTIAFDFDDVFAQ